jgi:Zn-finger nucleic acid-binding protein
MQHTGTDCAGPKRADTLRAMKCPIDDSPLSVSSRDGVEIDFCPQCRGVWLDRGELDKIIDRATNALTAAPAPSRAEPDYGARPGDYPPRGDTRDWDDRETRPGRRRKRNFLEDLFDFD